MLLERLVAEKGHASFGVGDTRAMESRKADPDVSQAKSESREKYRPFIYRIMIEEKDDASFGSFRLKSKKTWNHESFNLNILLCK